MGRTGFIRDQLDIRILALYLMSRVAAPVDFVTLADLAFCDDGVTYFYYAVAKNTADDFYLIQCACDQDAAMAMGGEFAQWCATVTETP